MGTRAGADAIVHAARAFLAQATLGSALVKLDITNAFNFVHRDSIFEVVAIDLPEILVLFCPLTHRRLLCVLENLNCILQRV